MRLTNNNLLRFVAVLTISALLGGCATLPGERDPRDPWESMNRSVYKFNEGADKVVFKPVAQAYRFVTPNFVRAGVTNFFSNLNDVVVFFNDIFQGKGRSAVADFGRVVINTTFGIGGLIDVAGVSGNPKRNEDFGQTLGVWGMGPGPYWMLPLLGPSTTRDAFGRGVDTVYSPGIFLISDWRVSYGLYILDSVNIRARLLETEKVLNEAGAVDRYAFLRDAYLQRREVLIYDGYPPKKKGDDDFSLEELNQLNEPPQPAATEKSPDK
jgi:phospholipid-binding lipoprotein MlaA